MSEHPFSSHNCPIPQEPHRPRRGYTTGSCAALAARAAARMALTGVPERSSAIVTPKGIGIETPLWDVRVDGAGAGCAVRKDAGDDPDVTDGLLIHVRVEKRADAAIRIDGGEGVGRVTRRGLDQPVGAAAINRVPRRMIEEEVRKVCAELGYAGGMSVTVSIPGGEEVAARTFNPSLGIVGGLSVIGTSGIVEPMSTQAVIDVIAVEMRMHRAEGVRDVLLTPGNYGEAFLRSHPGLAARPFVKCSNHIGAALDLAGAAGFASVLLVGHIGKLVKLAGGIMDTHSRTADCRMELLAVHAALCGADRATLGEVLSAVSVDDGLATLERVMLRRAVMSRLLEKMEWHLRRRSGGRFLVGAMVFSNHWGYLGATGGAERILAQKRGDNG